MDDMKRTRRREKPQKKWTDEENKLLLDYLLENENIERPSAYVYYSALLNKTKIDATPETTRCKVRYMKKTLLKAETWIKANSNCIDFDSIEFKNTVNKLCPYYDRLTKIFPIEERNTNVTTTEAERWCDDDELVAVKSEILDGLMETNSTSAEGECSWSEDMMLMVKPEIIDIVEEPLCTAEVAEPDAESISAMPKRTKNDDPLSKGANCASERPQGTHECSYKNSIRELTEFFKRRSELFEKRICIEKKKLDLEMKRLELEEEKMRKDFEIRKLELEQRERLAMQELKYKYNQK
ncbi:PREDICTED: uncharacterized protein LOC108380410 [Rhagoletis zephyria]|uniref:uncharacterized protein LOC108380410 n=1 Tax=Rhagoletis zephyria TaxID=28612 RepID=UPI0008118BC7|nr:PREDICTED: uncharacterized protein LOC108380410 [Rhagoletis zephyria]